MKAKVYYTRIHTFLAILLLACVFMSTTLRAETVLQIQQDQAVINPAQNLRYLRDASYALNWQRALTFDSTNWQTLQTDVPSFGFDTTPYWFKLEIHNPLSQTKVMLLAIEYPILDHIAAYTIKDGVLQQEYQLGDKFPFQQRPIHHHNFLIPLDFAANETLTVLLRIQTETSVQIPMELWQREAFFEEQSPYILGQGLYFGVILVMAVYNLFIYFTVRHSSYIYYALSALGMAGFLGSLHGLGFQYVWGNWPKVNDWITSASLAFFVGGAAAFTISLLQLKKNNILFYRAMLAIAWMNILLVVLSDLLPYRIAIKTASALGVVAAITALIIGIQLLRQGIRTARYYLLAYSFLWFGGILLSLNKFGLIPRNFFTEYALQICSIIEMVLLSFALADRINEEKRAKYLAQQLALQREKDLRIEQERYLQLEHNTQLDELKAQQKVIEAKAESRAKSEFLATMSHEIRTPMNGVLGMAELLQDTALDNTQRQYLNVITSSGKALLSIINDILDYSKIAAGKMMLEQSAIHLQDLCQEAMSVFYVMAERKGLTIQCLLDDNVPTYISADPVRLRQVLLNLLGNAFKFTEKGAVELRVIAIEKPTATKPDYHLRFEIRDSGIGISSEAQQNLFTAFNQADGTIQHNYGGTGLGLTICKQLVELMGGQIGVHSRSGEGSAFWFTIRCQAADAPLPTQAHLSRQRSTSTTTPESNAYSIRLRILVVEDNAVNQLVIIGMLKKLGVQYEAANDGVDALRLLTEQHDNFDLVLMDCEMPNMNGYDCAAAWREYERQHDLPRKPIIALTANVMHEHQQRALSAGMDAQLNKPIVMAELEQALRTLQTQPSN